MQRVLPARDKVGAVNIRDIRLGSLAYPFAALPLTIVYNLSTIE
jgi:hypothetical protein